MHVSLRAASSPVSKYTHTNTCMTTKELVTMQRNFVRLTDCPNTMAQEHKARLGGSAGCTAMETPFRSPQAFYIPRVIFCIANALMELLIHTKNQNQKA